MTQSHIAMFLLPLMTPQKFPLTYRNIQLQPESKYAVIALTSHFKSALCKIVSSMRRIRLTKRNYGKLAPLLSSHCERCLADVQDETYASNYEGEINY